MSAAVAAEVDPSLSGAFICEWRADEYVSPLVEILKVTGRTTAKLCWNTRSTSRNSPRRAATRMDILVRTAVDRGMYSFELNVDRGSEFATLPLTFDDKGRMHLGLVFSHCANGHSSTIHTYVGLPRILHQGAQCTGKIARQKHSVGTPSVCISTREGATCAYVLVSGALETSTTRCSGLSIRIHESKIPSRSSFRMPWCCPSSPYSATFAV